MTATAIEPRTGRSLVPEALFKRLTAYLVREDKLTPARAELVMDQALTFLGTLATRPSGGHLSPSNTVDPGWHAFVLHTREYAAWCNRMAGRFIHHNPLPGTGTRDGIVVRRTVDQIRAAGYAVAPEIWGSAAECNEPACDGDDGRPY